VALGCPGWDMARETDLMPRRRAAHRDSVQGQGARDWLQGKGRPNLSIQLHQTDTVYWAG
jgi:hypothetical protein